MKIDRLIGIIAELQRKKLVTAPELAEKFEVSRRTINRDVEDICKAGIPLVTSRGQGGGISIMDGYSLESASLTPDELAAVLTGLGSLDSVSDSPSAVKLGAKLGAAGSCGELEIDLASFYKESIAPKLALLRRAIRERRAVSFRYYYPKGESVKLVEPHIALYRWSDWYLYGYCPESGGFRLYKLRRLWELRETDEPFEPRELPPAGQRFGANITDDYFVTAYYDSSVKYRLVEERGPDSFSTAPDGRLLARWGFSGAESAASWLMSFGARAEAVDPPEIAELMRRETEKLRKIYSEHDI